MGEVMGYQQAIDAQLVAEKLSRVIQCRTVSDTCPDHVDWGEFEKLHRELQVMFPLVDQSMEKECFCEHAWLYRWKGSDPTQQPVILMAHQDVVPADDESTWEHAPFSGDIVEGLVWGRGALDMKSQMIAFFEAAELLLADGFQPKADIYFSLSMDEETAGAVSAKFVAQVLSARNLKFSYILDENLGFWDGSEWGIDRDLAVIGLCEKGYAVVALTATDAGGHASQPLPSPAQTALGHVAEAALKVNADPMPAKILPPCDAMMDAIVPYASDHIKKIWAERTQNEEKVAQELTKTRRGNAVFRTTFALTQAQGAKASNILPQEAKMCFNVRPAPWDAKEDILEHIRQTVDDETIQVQYEQYNAASLVSNMESPAYQTIWSAVETCFPEAIPVPSMMLAGTDSINFTGLSDCIIRFSAIDCYRKFAHTVHASNERVEIDSLVRAVRFFLFLMERV